MGLFWKSVIVGKENNVHQSQEGQIDAKGMIKQNMDFRQVFSLNRVLFNFPKYLHDII